MSMRPAIVIGLCIVLAGVVIALVPRFAPPTTPGTAELADLRSDLAQLKGELAQVKDRLREVRSAAPAAPDRPEGEEASPTAVKLTGADLFAGDTKRLRPHLPNSEGILEPSCVKLKYGGPLGHMRVVRQVWRKGQLDEVVVSRFIGIDLSKGQELSISVREVTRGDKPEYKVILGWPNSRGFFDKVLYVEKPEFRARNTLRHRLPEKGIDVKVPGEALIWGWGQTTDERAGDLIEGQLEEHLPKADWALGIKLVFSDEK